MDFPFCFIGKWKIIVPKDFVPHRILTWTCSRSCPSSCEPATTSLSAIHCSMSSTSRLSSKSLVVSSRRDLLSSARSFRPAYSLSIWDWRIAIWSLSGDKTRLDKVNTIQIMDTQSAVCHGQAPIGLNLLHRLFYFLVIKTQYKSQMVQKYFEKENGDYEKRELEVWHCFFKKIIDCLRYNIFGTYPPILERFGAVERHRNELTSGDVPHQRVLWPHGRGHWWSLRSPPQRSLGWRVS